MKKLLAVMLIASSHSLFCMDIAKLGLDAHQAVKENDKENLSWLMKSGHRSVLARNQWGNTILHEAVEQSNLEIAHNLILAGFEIDAENYLGKTPLMLAVESRDSRMITFLVSYGAKMRAIDTAGSSPLLAAVASGSNLPIRAIKDGITTRLMARHVGRLGSEAYSIEQ